MATLGEIEKLTKEYSEARDGVGAIVESIEEERRGIEKLFLPKLKKTVAMMTERQARLKAAIEESPEMFVKPRMFVLHGIKVGLQKQKGSITWEDDEQVVKMIKKLLPDTWETYIKVVEKPIKSALESLSVNELKKLGIEAIETGDEVIIKATDSVIEKFIKSLLKEDEVKEGLKDAA